MALLYFAQQFLDANGDPLSAGTLSVFDNNTTTPATIHSDPGRTTTQANPITLDAAGRLPNAVYVAEGTKYTVQLKDSSGTSQWSVNDTYGWAQNGESPAVNVQNAGVIGDGTTDDTAAIQAVIDSFTTGGVAYFPVGTYLISSTLDIDSSNISLVGEGGDRSHNVGGQGNLAATTIKWGGASGGTMVDIHSPEGASAQKQTGCGVGKIFFEANSLADIGVHIRSQSSGLYQDLHFEEFGEAGLKASCVATLGDPRDVNHNIFRQVNGRQRTVSASVFSLQGDTGATPTANVSLNYFENCEAIFDDGDAFSLGNTDHNMFVFCRAWRGGSGTGNAIVFEGNATAGGEVARHNTFLHFSGSDGPIVGRGTTSTTVASHDNAVLLADTGNGVPDPTVETGSTVYFSTDTGVTHDGGFFKAVIASSRSKVISERGNVGTETLRIHNGSSNHIRLVDGSSQEFGININSSNNELRVNDPLGGGKFRLAMPNFGFDTTPIAKQTISGARDDPEAALADLLTALAAFGFITDSTTAS